MDAVTTIDKTREILTNRQPDVFSTIYEKGKVEPIMCDASPVSKWVLGPDLFDSATKVMLIRYAGLIFNK